MEVATRATPVAGVGVGARPPSVLAHDRPALAGLGACPPLRARVEPASSIPTATRSRYGSNEPSRLPVELELPVVPLGRHRRFGDKDKAFAPTGIRCQAKPSRVRDTDPSAPRWRGPGFCACVPMAKLGYTANSHYRSMTYRPGAGPSGLNLRDPCFVRAIVRTPDRSLIQSRQCGHQLPCWRVGSAR